jgi:hypothetical protein
MSSPIVQNIKVKNQGMPSFKSRKPSKIDRGRSMSALKSETIVNGKLLKPVDKKLQIAKSRERVRTPVEEKKIRSLSKGSKKSKMENF